MKEMTDDDVEKLSILAGWMGNRKYMTREDFHIWCERMKLFARLFAEFHSYDPVALSPRNPS